MTQFQPAAARGFVVGSSAHTLGLFAELNLGNSDTNWHFLSVDSDDKVRR